MEVAILIIIAFAIYAGILKAQNMAYKDKILMQEIEYNKAFNKLVDALNNLSQRNEEDVELDRVQFGNFLLQSRNLEERNRVTDADLANFQEALKSNK